MAAQFAVDLVYKSKGTEALKKATKGLTDVEKSAQKAQGGIDKLTGKFSKSGQAIRKSAGGLEYFTDKLGRARKANGQFVTSTEAAANGIAATGRASKGAAVGVKSFGAAIKTALGPIGAALAAVAGLSAAFNTLKGQDFAEAKVKSLGVNAKELTARLAVVSRELRGAASVAELTGASYDVASAGFNNAADAANILKAASLGATGGFSDINTVANATTSVLNAYGMSAANAGTLVDQFIQTQNDGKIVVAQYAAEIGKVAAAAAGLGVPLGEVNAVIAQSTAAGVKGEVAFTGLKSALARFASGEAEKALKGTGVAISAASLEADGLLGTFKKLEKAGLDTGQIFKALGTEAAPALLPVLNNLEKYEELLQNQQTAAGVAAQAQATAAGTIEGAWNRLSNAFQNLFSDQNELGQVIRGTLLAAAATVEALAVAFKLVLAPMRAVIAGVQGVVKAMTGISDAESVLNSFTDVWFQVLQAVDDVSSFIIGAGVRIGESIGAMISNVAAMFQSLWGSITGGVQSVGPAITGAFADAFNAVSSMISAFWNSLPGWLQSALSMVGGAVGSIAGAVSNVVGKALGSVGDKVKEVAGALGKEIGVTLDVGRGFTASALGGLGGGGGSGGAIPQPLSLGGGGGGGGKGKGGGGGASEAEKMQKAIEKANQQYQELLMKFTQGSVPLREQVADQEKLNELLTGGATQEAAELQIEREREILNIRKEGIEALEELRGIENLNAEQLAEGEAKIRDLVQERIQLQEQLNAAKDQTAGLTTKEEKAESGAKSAMGDAAGGLASTLAGGLKNALITAVQGGDVGEAFQQLAEQMGQKFLDIAFSQLEAAFEQMFTGMLGGLDQSALAQTQAATQNNAAGQLMVQASMSMMQAAQMMAAAGMGGGGGGFSLGGLGGLFTPGGSLGSFGSGGFGGILGNSLSSFGGGFFPGFADGGYVSGPTNAVIGEGGEPEYVIPASKMGSAMSRYSMGQRGGSVVPGGAGEAEGSAMGGGDGSFRLETTVINNVEYATVDQVRAMGQSSAKQGAASGKAQTLGTLRNSRSQRSKLGLR